MAFTKSHSVTVTIANGAALSGVINMEEFTQGIIHMPAAWTAADIGFYVSSEVGGTYLPVSNASGLVVISGPAVDNAYVLPADIYPARYIKLWSNTAGSDENQGAARTLIVDLKT